MGNQKRLQSLYATKTLPESLYREFQAKAKAAGWTPHATLARLMRRFIARGFEDGSPEINENPDAPDDAATETPPSAPTVLRASGGAPPLSRPALGGTK